MMNFLTELTEKLMPGDYRFFHVVHDIETKEEMWVDVTSEPGPIPCGLISHSEYPVMFDDMRLFERA